MKLIVSLLIGMMLLTSNVCACSVGPMSYEKLSDFVESKDYIFEGQLQTFTRDISHNDKRTNSARRLAGFKVDRVYKGDEADFIEVSYLPFSNDNCGLGVFEDFSSIAEGGTFFIIANYKNGQLRVHDHVKIPDKTQLNFRTQLIDYFSTGEDGIPLIFNYYCSVLIQQAYFEEDFLGKFELGDARCERHVPAYDKIFRTPKKLTDTDEEKVSKNRTFEPETPIKFTEIPDPIHQKETFCFGIIDQAYMKEYSYHWFQLRNPECHFYIPAYKAKYAAKIDRLLNSKHRPTPW